MFLQDEGGSSQDQCIQTGDAYLLVYSITDRSSFLQASELRIALRQRRPAHHTPIILVGNKCDLVRRREVSVTGEIRGTGLVCVCVCMRAHVFVCVCVRAHVFVCVCAGGECVCEHASHAHVCLCRCADISIYFFTCLG